MSKIDISKIQPGDKFTVEYTARVPKGMEASKSGPCTILSFNSEILVCYEEEMSAHTLASRIVGHTPKPREIAVGDRIKLPDFQDHLTRTVKAVFDGQVAYEVSGGGFPYVSYRCEKLKKVQLVDGDNQ